MLDKLIEAVKTFKNSSYQSEASTQNSPGTEATINRLFPSIVTSRSTALDRFNATQIAIPNLLFPVLLVLRKRKQKKGTQNRCLISLLFFNASPSIESHPRGRFR